MSYFTPLLKELEKYSDKKRALGAKKYMRNQFEFLGVPAIIRNKLINNFIRSYGFPNDWLEALTEMWHCRWREIQYSGMHILNKSKKYDYDIEVLEFIITHKSWWDTVDFIATSIVNKYFLHNSDKENIIFRWIESTDIWLQRSAIIYQIRRKEETDFETLKALILRVKDSKEFFIKSAIGWALREYSKVDMFSVIKFIDQQGFDGFIRRSALEYIKRKKLLKN